MEVGWLFLAGLPAFLYALTNHIDKHLLEKHFKCDDGVATLVLISALVSVVALPAILFFGTTEVIPENQTHLLVFVFLGFLHVALLWFYLLALSEEDTVTIIVFYSILPVLGLIFANLFLGEVLLPMQLIAMAIIIVAVLIISVERNGEKKGFRIRWRSAVLMCLASLCWALGDTVFKAVAIEENVWRTLFWEHVVMFSIGALMFAFGPKLRKQLGFILRENSTRIISINMTNEVLYIVANVMSAFPLMLVQVAAVHLVQASQPIWVFLIALFLMYTGMANERFTREQLVQKSVATTLAVAGMFLLELYTPSA